MDWLQQAYTGIETIWTKVDEKSAIKDARERENAEARIRQESDKATIDAKMFSTKMTPFYIGGGILSLVIVMAMLIKGRG